MRKHTILTALALTFSLIIGIQLVITQVRANGIIADVDIKPNSLLLKEGGHGKWITAHIWFSEEDYDVNNIDISSVTLEVMGGHVPVSRYNIEGNILMVKFDRGMVIGFLWSMIQHMSPRVKSEVTFKVTGNLNGGNPFEGSDKIRVFFTQEEMIFP
ncbi:hypothetical protein E3J74_08955 [Candidatus Bathyarchaeota archaeon]|nr:MAG: hypothetical protein E3J74_08955 [Candidatus Bathyarchaeota archaeon]